MAKPIQDVRFDDDGNIIITNCDGSEELRVNPCGCKDKGDKPSDPIQSSRARCNVASAVANRLYIDLQGTFLPYIDGTPFIEPGFAASVALAIADTNLPAGNFPGFYAWAIAVKQAFPEAKDQSELSDNANDFICALFGCLSAETVELTPQVYECWRSKIRAFKSIYSAQEQFFEAAYGFMSAYPLSTLQEVAFNASISSTISNCNPCENVLPTECADAGNYNWLELPFDSPLITGGVPSCYANGIYSGGVCPNAIIGADGFTMTFDQTVCAKEVRWYTAGNSQTEWDEVAILVNGQEVARITRNNPVGTGQETVCRPVDHPFAGSFRAIFSNPIEASSIAIVPTIVRGQNPSVGLHLHCAKVRVVV